MAYGSSDEINQIIAEQNPWHAMQVVPFSPTGSHPRQLAICLGRLCTASRFNRYQLIIGPRRVGKTVVMYQVVQRLLGEGIDARRIWWLHLDHPVLMRQSLDAMIQLILAQSGATPQQPAYVFLDEITYAENWDLWLKTFYDERRPLRIVATSSSTATLRARRVESGVGRWEEQYLPPCLFVEYLGMRRQDYLRDAKPDLADFIQSAVADAPFSESMDWERMRYLLIGGFPELLLSEGQHASRPASRMDERQQLASEMLNSQRHLRFDAVQKALYVDIPQVFGIGEPVKLERLLYTLAGQIGGIFSPANLAKSVGLTSPTIDKYLHYFDRTSLIFLLPNYSANEEKIQRRGRKLYFLDGAVRNAALQRGIAALDDPAEMGLLLENAAAAHLHALGQQADVRVYYWRQGDQEVDLVYDDFQQPMAFEISVSPKHHISGLQAFQERHPRFAGRCYLVTPDPLAIAPQTDNRGGHTIGRLPLNLFLLATGIQSLAAMGKRFEVPPRDALNSQRTSHPPI